MGKTIYKVRSCEKATAYFVAAFVALGPTARHYLFLPLWTDVFLRLAPCAVAVLLVVATAVKVNMTGRSYKVLSIPPTVKCRNQNPGKRRALRVAHTLLKQNRH